MIGKLKAGLKKILLGTVWSFGPEDVIQAIHRAGVTTGDVLMVHSRFRADSGFRGNCQELVQAFIDSVGPEGTLCMMSMPFHAMTAFDYLKKEKIFDVRRTVSMVGLPSELFRRRQDVRRSVHPTHPVAACGKKAQWLIDGPCTSLSPFGPGSPFDKLVTANARILMFDVPFNTMTFEHYLEDRFSDRLPFTLYHPEVFQTSCRDATGGTMTVPTQVLSPDGNRYRSSDQLFQLLKSEKIAVPGKVKRVEMVMVDAARAVDTIEKRTTIY